ncbi:hypothetical protein [Methylobacterium sp. ID0610]|uniref:hypothetical protein n=1 Tax=Methylobacterium carpenticola TaxID=3344827 RepID=UPI00368DA03E
MAKTDQARPSLRDFDPYTDRNGQDMGQDSPLDVGIPSRTQEDLKSDPNWDAQVARIASDDQRLDSIGATDASEQTARETPPETLRRISDPSPRPATEEAIDRATAAVGHEDERGSGR